MTWVPRRLGVLATLVMVVAGGAVQAQQLLYTPPPPRGSAQVRFINATSAPITVSTGVLPPSKLGQATTDRVGTYGTIPAVAGKSFSVTIEAGGARSTVPLSFAADHQISVIVTADAKGPHTYAISDEVEFNQVRSRLRFYNGAPSCATAGLQLKPGGQAVFEDVKPGETAMRAVNPVTADVSAMCNGAAGPDLHLSGMEVGRGYSVWVIAPAGPPMVFLSPDGNALFQP